MRHTLGMLTGGLVLLACAGMTGSQPEGAPQRAPGIADQGVLDPDVLRERLKRRLSELDRFQRKLQAALDGLDGGATPLQIARQFADDPEFQRLMGRMRRAGAPPGDGIGPEGGRGPGPERGPERPEHGPHSDQPVTEAERGRMLTFMRNHLPTFSDRWLGPITQSPDSSERFFNRVAPRLRELMFLEERDPGLFMLRLEDLRSDWGVGDAARALRRAMAAHPAGDPAIASADAKLREAVARHMDAQAKLRAHEIEMLSKRLETLRSELNDQSARREQRLDEQVARFKAFIESGKPEPGPGPGPRGEQGKRGRGDGDR